MKFENTRVMNFEGAIRGMRNPKESWHLSDSVFGFYNFDVIKDNIIWFVSDSYLRKKYLDTSISEYHNGYSNSRNHNEEQEKINSYLLKNGILQTNKNNAKKPYFCNAYNCLEKIAEVAFIGAKDMNLARTLIKAGSEHRKFMRQIFVSVDITAPLYWWKEFDTYKVGTVANSTSTMHKLTSKPIDFNSLEIDDLNELEDWENKDNGWKFEYNEFTGTFVAGLEGLRQKYLETKDKRVWKELVRWIPDSWLQTRTVTMNYENLYAMCSSGQRRKHKLNEWSGIDDEDVQYFINWARSLPYAQDFIFVDEAPSILCEEPPIDTKEVHSYKKKPVVIKAYQTDKEMDIPTLEGIMHASIGDYIITGINGEQYPCKPDIFAKTYEIV